MTFNLTKNGDYTDLDPSIMQVGAVLEWDQAAGRFQRKIDVDCLLGVFAGDITRGYVEPKGRTSALDDAVKHTGDVKKPGQAGECIEVDFTKIRDYDNDIDGMLFAAVCAKNLTNFSGINFGVARFFNRTNGGDVHIGNVRFSTSSTATGLILAHMKRRPDNGWRLTLARRECDGRRWSDIAPVTAAAMRAA